MSCSSSEVGRLARRLIGRLLRLPLPQKLTRARGPWESRPLADRKTSWWAARREASSTRSSRRRSPRRGGYPVVARGDAEPFRELGKAYGRPAAHASISPPCRQDFAPTPWSSTPPGSTVPPGCARSTTSSIRSWPSLRAAGASSCSAVHAEGGGDAAVAAAPGALDGFVRSLAKEIGRRGATAELVWA